MDIVDQHHRPAGKARAGIRREREGTGDRSCTGRRTETAQHRRGLYPAQQIGRERHAMRSGEGGCDQPGLVVAARPEPPAMERHRDQQFGLCRHQPGHGARHGGGAGEPSRIFELERDRPRHLAIGDCGAHAVMRRRIGDAGGAARAFAPVVIEGDVAGGAPGRAEEAEASPAGSAEAMVRRRDRAAARATRRQREIRDVAHGSAIVAEPGHACLVPGGAAAHKRAMPHNGPSDSSEIFDRALRRKRRDRAARHYEGFVREHMLEGIQDRLAAVTRAFGDVLDLGSFGGGFELPGARITRIDAGARFATMAGGIQADEDRHPFPEASFDLVVSVGVLDQINDVPGALALARRALRPDGLFLGAFLGAGTLATLRGAFLKAEAERPAARFHPQIDVRAAGDLLTRAGFALPVADVETLTVRYGSMFSLLRDLRGMAATNLLPGTPPLTRNTLAGAAQAFAERADPDGRTAERFEIVYLTGWAPDESQPKPARRGSATTSLAEALRAKQ